MENIDKIKGYHAHIYFQDNEKKKAKSLQDAAIKAFSEVDSTDWMDEPRGPHPVANFVMEFMCDQFPNVVPWLSLNRDGLSVLVHPMTGDAPTDHSDYALWLGDRIDVHLDRFSGKHDHKFGL
jgi:aromatic ring-cleaving dioxygenase